MTVSGSLFGGQELRATAFVEAGHVYHISASLTPTTAGATGLDEIAGIVSGAPLAEPVGFSVESSSGGGSQGSQPCATFVPYVDGEVAIEFAFVSAGSTGSTGSAIEWVRLLISGPPHATYELLLTDLGIDDNGTSPGNAVALAVGPEGERTGTMTAWDEADYFTVQVQADTAYQLNLESTDSVNVTSGAEDRFGQINFGVPTASGLLINVSASAGVPGTSEFTATAAEEVLLRLTAPGLGGSVFDPTAAVTIQYAISVVEVVPEGE